MFNKKNNEDGVSASGTPNIIDKSTEITGSIVSAGSLRIDGLITGKVETKSRLVIGLNGIIDGDIVCQSAEISGTIKGNIVCKEHLHLKNTSKIHGDILVDKITVEAGAYIQGKIGMSSAIKDIRNTTNNKKESSNSYLEETA